MEKHPQHGAAQGNWESEGSILEPHYSEKPSDEANTKKSKLSIWRIFRLGVSLALTIAALALTLIVLIVGRHGNAGSGLALITVTIPKNTFSWSFLFVVPS